MSNTVLILAGPYAGKTVNLKGIQFNLGRAEIPGDPEKNSGLIKYMQTCYQAYLEGSQVETPVIVVPTPEIIIPVEVPVVEPEKQPEIIDDEKLIAAINGLDHTNDEHWTQNGLPSIDAVSTLLGHAGITRKDITAAIPGFKRKEQEVVVEV